MVQPPPDPTRPRRTLARRVRGCLADQPAAPTPTGYPPTGGRQSQIEKSPGNRGRFFVKVIHDTRSGYGSAAARDFCDDPEILPGRKRSRSVRVYPNSVGKDPASFGIPGPVVPASG